jgi:hypothetical protein
MGKCPVAPRCSLPPTDQKGDRAERVRESIRRLPREGDRRENENQRDQ